MHGMLSAAVMLAAFAVIALAAAASVVWLYRAAGASPQRSRPALAGRAGDAAGPDTLAAPDVPAAPDVAGPGPDDGIAAPDAGAGPRVAADVYDVEDWAGLDGSHHLDGSASRGPGAWPNPSSSLYSRGWPAMDSSRTPQGQAYAAEPQDPDQPASGSHDGRGAENPADSREPGGREPGTQEPGGREPGTQEPGGPPAAAGGRAEGARVYVLGESRRRGR